ncbi:uncharacterized protein LOC134209132 [Armigeres subalbatus]|uniref:uncharacterized protein LOC134209132 n=1 Tax=Armigeres subalbatus TaxID=124917 RepID=UPI002ED62280
MKYQQLVIIFAVISALMQPTEPARLNGIQAGLGEERRSSLFVNRIGQCEGFQHLPVFIPDSKIAQLNGTHYVTSGILVFHRAYEGNLSGSVWIEKCNTTKHCKPFTRTIPIPDACAYLEAVDPELVAIQNHFKPPFHCPFRTGVFRFNDLLTDNTLYLYLSPHVSNDWRVIITGSYNDKMILCLSMEVSIYDWEEMLVKTMYQ